MSASAGLSLTDFTASELPTKKWMKLVRPKMRLRVHVQNCEFVSSTVKVCDQSPDEKNPSSIHWPWNDDERFPRPSFTNNEVFEVKVERRFLLWYKCILRTKPVTIREIPTGDCCVLPLYDGQYSAEMLEDKIKIGTITFTLRSGAAGEVASPVGVTIDQVCTGSRDREDPSEDKTSATEPA